MGPGRGCAGVLCRLLEAQRSLPADVRLLVIEGYRPPALQRDYFEGHRADLARAHPDWSPEHLDAEAGKHVAAPSVPPHPCGAAVDLTLVWAGHELDLGTEVNATPRESAGACFTAAGNIGDNARQWRQLLGSALSGAGPVNSHPVVALVPRRPVLGCRHRRSRRLLLRAVTSVRPGNGVPDRRGRPECAPINHDLPMSWLICAHWAGAPHRSGGDAVLGERGHRIDVLTADSHLEVQMWAGDVPGRTDVADQLAGVDHLSEADGL